MSGARWIKAVALLGLLDAAAAHLDEVAPALE